MQLPPEVNVPRRRNRDTPLLPGAPSGNGEDETAGGSGRAAGLPPVSAELVDRELGRGYRWLRFAPALEAQFEAEDATLRRRRLFVAGAIGMVAVDLFALDNPFVLPDVADLSWKLRLWLTPLCLLTLASLRLPLRGWKLDAIFAATAVAVALAVLGLIGASHVGVAVSHLPALLLVPMFAAVVMRLRFWPALGASLTILLAIPVFLHGRDPTQTAIVRDAGLVVTVATLISLLACYALERRDRTAFLMELRDRRRRQALNEANERLRRLSMLDPLTGVYNRSQFDIDLETAWMHAAFTGEPLSLLVVDVDCFKELIDGSGRLEADTCLRRIAGVLGDVAAESKGTVARLASEEFAILLPGRTLESAVRIGESLRRAVLALRVANEDSTVAEHVSVSVGAAAALPTAQDKPVALLQTADDALHQAKGGGRNRVVACRMQTSMTLAAGLH